MPTKQYSREELLLWLCQHPDGTGECDGCHKDDEALWELPEALEPGWFMYCRECFRKAVERHFKASLDV